MPSPVRQPINTARAVWTSHARAKLRQYQLSPTRVLRVIRRPSRIEAGVAPQTIAVMQPASAKQTSEIWAMYQQHRDTGQLTIITAWRYPGKSPIRSVPLPAEIAAELDQTAMT